MNWWTIAQRRKYTVSHGSNEAWEVLNRTCYSESNLQHTHVHSAHLLPEAPIRQRTKKYTRRPFLDITSPASETWQAEDSKVSWRKVLCLTEAWNDWEEIERRATVSPQGTSHLQPRQSASPGGCKDNVIYRSGGCTQAWQNFKPLVISCSYRLLPWYQNGQEQHFWVVKLHETRASLHTAWLLSAMPCEKCCSCLCCKPVLVVKMTTLFCSWNALGQCNWCSSGNTW